MYVFDIRKATSMLANVRIREEISILTKFSSVNTSQHLALCTCVRLAVEA